MPRLILDLYESIYDKIYWFISIFPKQKLKIQKIENQSKNHDILQFVNTYAGFLKDTDISENYRDERTNYLTKKYN